MSLVSRYILKAHAGPFLFGFSIFTFILMMQLVFEIVNRIVGKGLGIILILEILVFNLAWIVAMAIPAAVLVAALMGFGRLSADNELTAMKAGGVSFYSMIVPALVGGCLLAVGDAIFMDRVLPEANYRVRTLMNDVYRARPTLSFREGIFMDELPGYSILIDRINPRNNDISSITIYETPTAKPAKVLTAQRGTLDVAPDGSRVTLTLFDGELHYRDETNPDRYVKEVFERQKLAINRQAGGVQRTQGGSRGDRELTIQMMNERIEGWQRDLEASRHRLSLVMADPTSTIEHRQAAEKREEQIIISRERQINSFLVEIYKKYAIPFACITFVLIGAPLGARIRKSGMGISIGVSLGFFLLYWSCLIGGEGMADRHLISPWLSMWAANILIGVPGLFLVILTAKERFWR